MSLDSLNNIPEKLGHNLANYQPDQKGLGVDTVIIFMAVGGIVFGFFYVLKKYILPLLKAGKTMRKTKLLSLRIEIVTWLLFTLIALTQFFTQTLLITSVLVIVIAMVGFNFWRDFFPGLVFRVSDKFRVKDPVRFQEYSGVLKKIGVTSIYIKTEEEELVYIPYHKIANGLFIKRQAKGKLMSSKIILQIGTKNPSLVIDGVSKWIHECPWAIAQPTNKASIQAGGLLNVTVYAIDSQSLGKVERYIKTRLESF